jgi:hypothetical protein
MFQSWEYQYIMEDEVRKVLAEAGGGVEPTVHSDVEDGEEFHDTTDMVDNDLTRPSDWTPGQLPGKMSLLF